MRDAVSSIIQSLKHYLLSSFNFLLFDNSNNTPLLTTWLPLWITLSAFSSSLKSATFQLCKNFVLILINYFSLSNLYLLSQDGGSLFEKKLSCICNLSPSWNITAIGYADVPGSFLSWFHSNLLGNSLSLEVTIFPHQDMSCMEHFPSSLPSSPPKFYFSALLELLFTFFSFISIFYNTSNIPLILSGAYLSLPFRTSLAPPFMSWPCKLAAWFTNSSKAIFLGWKLGKRCLLKCIFFISLNSFFSWRLSSLSFLLVPLTLPPALDSFRCLFLQICRLNIWVTY